MAIATKRTEKQILWDLAGVESGLEPENLSADGERSRTEQNRRYRELMARKTALIAELGRTPSDSEVWNAERP